MQTGEKSRGTRILKIVTGLKRETITKGGAKGRERIWGSGKQTRAGGKVEKKIFMTEKPPIGRNVPLGSQSTRAHQEWQDIEEKKGTLQWGGRVQFNASITGRAAAGLVRKKERRVGLELNEQGKGRGKV